MAGQGRPARRYHGQGACVPLAFAMRYPDKRIMTGLDIGEKQTGVEARAAAHEPQGWRHHFSETIRLGLPLAGAQLAQIALNATDVVMLGWYGTRELAASVLATQFFFLVMMFGSGFANAIIPLAASAHGVGDTRQVRRAVRMGVWVILVYATLAMPLLWFLEPILILLGQDPDLSAIAADYIHIAQWALYPALFTLVMRSFLASVGSARMVLIAALIGVVVNAVLDYALIFGRFGAPELGVKGAAIATLGTALAIAIVMAGHAAWSSRLRVYEIFIRFWRPEWPAFLEIIRLGLPISLTIIAEAGLFMAASLMIGWIGRDELAAHGIALQLVSIAFMIPYGLSSVAAVRVGQAHGRRDRIGIARAAFAVMSVALAVSVAGAILFWTLPAPLVGLFLGDDDPARARVLALGVTFLAIGALFQVVDCMQAIGAGLLRGLRDTRQPMIIAVFSYWCIGAVAAYGLAFPLGLAGAGVWTGLALGLTVAAILLNYRFYRREAYGLV